MLLPCKHRFANPAARESAEGRQQGRMIGACTAQEIPIDHVGLALSFVGSDLSGRDGTVGELIPI
jgi:hypothetical protein